MDGKIVEGSRSLLCEFLANVYSTKKDEVMVRGTIVDFSPRPINDFFDLSHYAKDEYSIFLLSPINTGP